MTGGIISSLLLCRTTEKQLSSSNVGEALEKKICGGKATQPCLGEQPPSRNAPPPVPPSLSETQLCSPQEASVLAPSSPFRFDSGMNVSRNCRPCRLACTSSCLTGVFWAAAEDAFLSAVISSTNSSTVHFRLSPAYILYAAARFALQQEVKGQSHRVTRITAKMVAMMRKVLQAREQKSSRKSERGEFGRAGSSSGSVFVLQGQQAIAGALAFWMANASELLNFLKRDRDLRLLTRQSQRELSQLVHRAYRYAHVQPSRSQPVGPDGTAFGFCSCLLRRLQTELRVHLPTFLADPEQRGSLPAGIGNRKTARLSPNVHRGQRAPCQPVIAFAEMVLSTLMTSMSLLRRCRVNPALTIQLFSQLFHFISAWLLNQLLSLQASARGLRSHYWGAALRHRLVAMEAWAERQGLELAAACHLGRLIQVRSKTSAPASVCYKLLMFVRPVGFRQPCC